MIIVKLMGGLGNQMFQYAFGKKLSFFLKKPLKIDLSFLNRRDLGFNFIYRDYCLDVFKLNVDFLNEPVEYTNINESYFHYSSDIENFIYKNYNKNILLDGYWQTPLYFNDIQNIIKQDFVFKNNVLNEISFKNLIHDIKTSNSVMVNVRRTDYLNTNYHGVMGIDYFEKCVNVLQQKIDNPKFFIFSDDIEWCKQNLKIKNSFFVDHFYAGKKFEYYLQLMIMCNHFIIPNSTFAWWSAWLSENPSKIILCPSKWFNDTSINTADLIPPTWFKL